MLAKDVAGSLSVGIVVMLKMYGFCYLINLIITSKSAG